MSDNSRVENILDVALGNADASTIKTPQSRVEILLIDLIRSINSLDGKIPIHICSNNEFDALTGVPIISNPSIDMFYLVPSGSGNNLYSEWIYTINGNWEMFGKDSDIIIPQSDWSQSNSSASDFIKNKPDVYTKTETESKISETVPQLVSDWLNQNITNGDGVYY